MAHVDKPFVLFGDTSPLKPVGEPDTVGELPRRRFVKDLIHSGTYKHPKDGWTMYVTPDRMDVWVASFNKMRENGRGVEAVKDHSFKAEDKVGDVVDMYREGDTLYAVHEFIGDDAINLAQRVNTVSPWIEPNFKDGRNEYGESIVHSAIVQQPVIDSQQPFKAMAASLSGTNASPLIKTNGASKMDLTELRTVLGAGDELTEDNAIKMVRDRITNAESEKTSASTKAQEAEAKVLQLESKLTEAAAKHKTAPDADTLEMQAEVAGERFDALAEQGRVTPAVAASLKTLLVGDKGKRNAYALSATYSGRDASLAREIVDILKTNDPVELGEKTRAQGKALSFADLADDKQAEAKKAAAAQLRAGAGLKTA